MHSLLYELCLAVWGCFFLLWVWEWVLWQQCRLPVSLQKTTLSDFKAASRSKMETYDWRKGSNAHCGVVVIRMPCSEGDGQCWLSDSKKRTAMSEPIKYRNVCLILLVLSNLQAWFPEFCITYIYYKSKCFCSSALLRIGSVSKLDTIMHPTVIIIIKLFWA